MNILRMSSKSVRWAYNFGKWNPTPSEMLLASSCIQQNEKERVAKFVFKKDLKASLIGCLMMRKYVSHVTSMSYDKINFVRDSLGKPMVENEDLRKTINFNISHHGNFTIFVGEVGDTKLGVDVMKLEYSGGKSLKEFFRVMNRQFGHSEWATIKGAGDEKQQTAMFCRYWCLKESYVKAIGVGLRLDLQDISFKIKTKDLSTENVVTDTEIYFEGEKLDWEFHEMLLDDDHCVSVAFENHHKDKVLFQELTFNEMMENSAPLSESDDEFCKKYFTKLERPN